METINNVLNFLNYIVFVADLGNDEYSNYIHTKKVLTDIFQDVDSTQLILMLGVIVD